MAVPTVDPQSPGLEGLAAAALFSLKKIEAPEAPVLLPLSADSTPKPEAMEPTVSAARKVGVIGRQEPVPVLPGGFDLKELKGLKLWRKYGQKVMRKRKRGEE